MSPEEYDALVIGDVVWSWASVEVFPNQVQFVKPRELIVLDHFSEDRRTYRSFRTRIPSWETPPEIVKAGCGAVFFSEEEAVLWYRITLMERMHGILGDFENGLYDADSILIGDIAPLRTGLVQQIVALRREIRTLERQNDADKRKEPT